MPAHHGEFVKPGVDPTAKLSPTHCHLGPTNARAHPSARRKRARRRSMRGNFASEVGEAEEKGGSFFRFLLPPPPPPPPPRFPLLLPLPSLRSPSPPTARHRSNQIRLLLSTAAESGSPDR
uniref:Uncharacterized protein n=1 Tax=Oryza brachyantha TaxID=4533 RepID=J3L550_ORYBR